MKRLSFGGLLLGLALATVLITWQGWQRITDVLNIAGLAVFWLPVYFLLPLACALLSWLCLFPKKRRPGAMLSLYCTWINFAINWLLPVAQVGGEVARVRLLLKRQFVPGEAIASVIGDQTLQIISQAVYAFSGIILLVWVQIQRPSIEAGLEPRLAEIASSGQSSVQLSVQLLVLMSLSLMVLVAISVGLYWLQQKGLFKLFSKIAHKFPTVSSQFSADQIRTQAAAIDQALMAMYQRRDRLLMASLWRLGFRVLAAGETWLALKFLGYPVDWVDALILESLGQAIRSAAFLLPGGLGAQEGGMMLIGAALGIPIELGLSVSLCKRIRELVIGVPGLVALQIEEGRRIWTKPF